MLWWCDNELYVALSSIHPLPISKQTVEYVPDMTSVFLSQIECAKKSKNIEWFFKARLSLIFNIQCD